MKTLIEGNVREVKLKTKLLTAHQIRYFPKEKKNNLNTALYFIIYYKQVTQTNHSPILIIQRIDSPFSM